MPKNWDASSKENVSYAAYSKNIFDQIFTSIRPPVCPLFGFYFPNLNFLKTTDLVKV